MKRLQGVRRLLRAALLGAMLVVAIPGVAQAADDATCISCHDAADDPDLFAIGRTKHGVRADSRTPGCTSCHGDSKVHMSSFGNRATSVIFNNGAYPISAVGVINASCLSCHGQNVTRHLWTDSAHERHEVARTARHTLHVAHDPVQDKRRQPQVFYA